MDREIIEQILRLRSQYSITLKHIDYRLKQDPSDISHVSELNLFCSLDQLVEDYNILRTLCDDRGISIMQAIKRNLLELTLNIEPIIEIVEWRVNNTEQNSELNNA
jgi:hypothetical protein